MNVRVGFELFDQREREMFEDFVQDILAWRDLTAVERHEKMLPDPVSAPAPEPAKYSVEPCPKCGSNDIAIARNMKATRHCGKCHHTWLPAPEPKSVTDAELEKAITTYWKAQGLPAAKALLKKYGVERVGAIPAEQRAQALLDMGF